MTPEEYKEHVKAKDMARKSTKGKGAGRGAKKGGAVKGMAPLSKSRDGGTGDQLVRLWTLFMSVFENACASSSAQI
jgi:hypothetical protein